LTYRIVYTPAARRALSERLPPSAAAACVELIGSVLAENPRRVAKPLRGALEGLYSARRGEFRVIYAIDDEEIVVLVVTIAHRRDAYRA
jgi:mRNA interferase RelE/StbE